MSARILYVLLVVVAGCAAVLSFAALRDLALVCGFARWSAPLLPLVIDAGAAAGTLAWLTRPGRARAFGRLLALVLLAASVAGNAVGHALSAYAAAPPWGLVVTVSGVAPAVLGAVVHLAVVAARRNPAATPEQAVADPVVVLPPAAVAQYVDVARHAASADAAPGPQPADPPIDAGPTGRVAELIAAGAGRRRLARELGVSEHQARAMLAASRNGAVS